MTSRPTQYLRPGESMTSTTPRQQTYDRRGNAYRTEMNGDTVHGLPKVHQADLENADVLL